MNTLATFQQQRDYIQDKLKITEPLTLATLERINGEVAFSHIHKLEVALKQQNDDLQLLPSSERIKERISELNTELSIQLEPVNQILADIKVEAGEYAIKQAKAKEVLADAHQKIRELCDDLNRDSNKYNSVVMADLSRVIRASTGIK